MLNPDRWCVPPTMQSGMSMFKQGRLGGGRSWKRGADCPLD